MECKLKIKFGEHEFEAEGPVDAVQNHFVLFRQLVAPAVAPPQDSQVPLHKMMLIQGRTVFSKFPAKAEDAVLLLLLGQKEYRNNDQVTGAEIMRGLRQSGVRIPRADYIIRKHIGDGNIISTGMGRKRRYRLSDRGREQAMDIARELSPLVKVNREM